MRGSFWENTFVEDIMNQYIVVTVVDGFVEYHRLFTDREQAVEYYTQEKQNNNEVYLAKVETV